MMYMLSVSGPYPLKILLSLVIPLSYNVREFTVSSNITAKKFGNSRCRGKVVKTLLQTSSNIKDE